MKIEQRVVEAVTVLELSDRLTAAVAAQLRAAVDDAIAAGADRIVLDLAQVPFIDSSGLGAVIGALKAARTAGGDLRLASAGDQVRQVLRLTNLDRVLRVYDDAGSAFDGD